MSHLAPQKPADCLCAPKGRVERSHCRGSAHDVKNSKAPAAEGPTAHHMVVLYQNAISNKENNHLSVHLSALSTLAEN